METSSRISPINRQESNGISQMKPQRKEEPEMLIKSFKLHVPRFFALTFAIADTNQGSFSAPFAEAA